MDAIGGITGALTSVINKQPGTVAPTPPRAQRSTSENTMTTNKSIIIAAAISVVIAICAPQLVEAKSDGKSVTVNNTTANPVPVTVQNPVTGVSVKSLDNPALQPYAQTAAVALNASQFAF